MTTAECTTKINELLRKVREIRQARWEIEWAYGKHEDAPPPPKMKGTDEERTRTSKV